MKKCQKYKFKVIPNFSEFEQIRHPWDQLLELSEIDKVFMTHEWFTAWWQAFGEGRQLYIIVVTDEEDQYVAIVPMMVEKIIFRGLPVRCIKFIENNDSPGCGFIIKKGHEEISSSIISYLVNAVKDWNIIILNNLQYDDELVQNIRKILEQSNKKYFIRSGLSSPYIKVTNNWDNYYESLSTKSRKTLRNIINRMKRLDDIEIKKCTTIGSLNDIISITKKGWKYKEGKAFLNNKSRERFFKLLSEIAQKNKWLSIWLIYKGINPIAYEYHLKYKTNEIALLSEYDSNYKSCSPGSFLDYEIIKSMFNSNIKEYDMCGSDDEYKKKWTNHVSNHIKFIIFNSSIFSKCLYFYEDKPIRLIRTLRNKVRNVN